MRIAVSGSHGTGKSALVECLGRKLPNYAIAREPYDELVEQGNIFRHPPTAEDFEIQLEFSIRSTFSSAEDTVFERCPVDFLAYLSSVRCGSDVVSSYFKEAASAIAQLALIIYVPIERPDRIELNSDEAPGLRKRVDASLRKILVDDEFGLSCNVVEVSGDTADRCEQAMRGVLTRCPGAIC